MQGRDCVLPAPSHHPQLPCLCTGSTRNKASLCCVLLMKGFSQLPQHIQMYARVQAHTAGPKGNRRKMVIPVGLTPSQSHFSMPPTGFLFHQYLGSWRPWLTLCGKEDGSEETDKAGTRALCFPGGALPLLRGNTRTEAPEGLISPLDSGSQPSSCRSPSVQFCTLSGSPTVKLVLLLLHNCSFASVTNRNVNICDFLGVLR